jgi:hypothetical protein
MSITIGHFATVRIPTIANCPHFIYRRGYKGGNAVAMKMAPRSGCRGPHIQMPSSTRIVHWNFKQ